MGMHHGGDKDLDNKDERSNEAVSLEMSARPKPLRPLQY
jgi:hypothetical protein